MPIQPNRILVLYGEISLKGKNRVFFERALCKNIEHRLRRAGLSCPVRRTHGRIMIDIVPDALPGLRDLLHALREIPGIVWLAPTVWLPAPDTGPRSNPPDLARIEQPFLQLARAHCRPEATFAVRVRRADKRFPIVSQELERRLGALLIERSEWNKVRLKKPDVTFHLDIYQEGVYLYTEKLPGIGGLPVGTEGRVLSLLSGGIDSPVAAYLLAKRGCYVDFIHMTATHVQQTQLEDSLIAELARRISRFTLRSRLYLVPSVHFDVALFAQRTDYNHILFRRFLGRAAQTLAERCGALALVTGDNLGQVASQTLENIVTNSRAIEMPILHPLIGYNKQEIVNLARQIGTYETSIQPYKDCCALLSQNPQTKSRHHRVSRLEARSLPNYQALVEATLADAVCLEFDCGERVG